MPTLFDTPTPTLFASPLTEQFLEASTRAITASADLYTEVLRSQADATAGLIEAYLAIGRQTAATGREAVETADEAATTVVRRGARATQRATKRTTRATRKAVAKPARTAAAAAAPARAAARAAAQVAEAPITGYDDLTAEDVVAKLPELTQAELVQVTAYERAHDARTTVLDRVKALTGPEPAPGYDELTAEEVQTLLTGGDAELAAAVRDYERRHKGRTGVIDAAVRNADAS
jgi:hypothetical protein